MPYADIEKRRAVARRSYYKNKGKRYLLTWERLVNILHYAPKTGKWTWIKSTGRSKAGTLAGSIGNHGYVQIRIDNCTHLAHRLAIFYLTKKWPMEEIDHVKGCRADNRKCAIREATHTQNMWNAKISKNNKSGFKGVCNPYPGKWRAELCHQGVRYCLGTYDTPLKAHKAYAQKAKQLYGEFARLR